MLGANDTGDEWLAFAAGTAALWSVTVQSVLTTRWRSDPRSLVWQAPLPDKPDKSDYSERATAAFIALTAIDPLSTRCTQLLLRKIM